MVRVTFSASGAAGSPRENKTIVPEYVPDASPEVLTDTETLEGVEPLAGLTLSHGALVEAVQASAPVPVADSPTVCAAGLGPPAVAEKLRAEAPGASDSGLTGEFPVTRTLSNVTGWFETSKPTIPFV